jgi:hypothetical protein
MNNNLKAIASAVLARERKRRCGRREKITKYSATPNDTPDGVSMPAQISPNVPK